MTRSPRQQAACCISWTKQSTCPACRCRSSRSRSWSACSGSSWSSSSSSCCTARRWSSTNGTWSTCSCYSNSTRTCSSSSSSRVGEHPSQPRTHTSRIMWWWETGSQMQAIWVTTEVPAWRAARSIQADRRAPKAPCPGACCPHLPNPRSLITTARSSPPPTPPPPATARRAALAHCCCTAAPAAAWKRSRSLGCKALTSYHPQEGWV
mmetsp:Transcript_7190/g.17316  ORF Transcript_7190/g.17316 Transcript_7190/m.17316 type:complete len:208 (+) Transcript_7190:596-1219(+)